MDTPYCAKLTLQLLDHGARAGYIDRKASMGTKKPKRLLTAKKHHQICISKGSPWWPSKGQREKRQSRLERIEPTLQHAPQNSNENVEEG